MEPDALESAASQRRSGKNLHMMGRNVEELEYRFPRYYVSKILAIADRKHVPVIFLYLPAYGQVDYPFDTKLYDGRGKIITVNDILLKTENWADLDHLNLFGAAELSARLGAVLAHDVLNLTVGARSDPGSRSSDGTPSFDLSRFNVVDPVLGVHRTTASSIRKDS
jgi:hypothetical protein